MRKMLMPLAVVCAVFFAVQAYAEENHDAYITHIVKKGETLWTIAHDHWKTVAKVNRISPDRLKAGMKLIIPYNWEMAEQNAPVPRELPGVEGKLILVDINAQVFGAYENSILILWGPISSSAERVECGWAHEKKHKCVTPTGDFCVLGKDKDHVSDKYPPPSGGAPMKYAIRFHGDYWIHAGALPGHPDSHGCVRVLFRDAQWLFRWTNKKTRIIVIKDPLLQAGLFYENKKTGMAYSPSPWFGSPHYSGLFL